MIRYLLVIILTLLSSSVLVVVNCDITTKTISTSTLEQEQQPSKVIDRIGDQVSCTICTFITQETEKYLKRGVNDTQIINILDNDCERFGNYESTCENIVGWYTPTIIYLLNKNQPIQEICSELRLC